MKMTYGYCRVCHIEITKEADMYILTAFLTKPYISNVPVNGGGSCSHCSGCIKHIVKFPLDVTPDININLLEKDSNG